MLLRTGSGRSRNFNTLATPAMSPDGTNVYLPDGAYGRDGALLVLRRDPATGSLHQLPGRDGCISASGRYRCARARGIKGVKDVAVAPDGQNVYAVASGADAVLAFRRNPSTGALAQLLNRAACVSSRKRGCARGRALVGSESLWMTPEGHGLYVLAHGIPTALVVLKRARDGALRQLAGTSGCLVAPRRNGERSTRDPTRKDCGRLSKKAETIWDIAISPDGRHVYTAAGDRDDVSVFATGIGNPRLTPLRSCIPYRGSRPCGLTTDEQGVALASSPDGRNVYLIEQLTDRIDAFARDAVSGALTKAPAPFGCDRASACHDTGLTSGESLVFSADGHVAYYTLGAPSAVLVNHREASGALMPFEAPFACVGHRARGCVEGRGLQEVTGVLLSPDGRNAYVYGNDSIAVFTVAGAPTP